MDKSAGGEGNDSYIVKTVLRKNKAMLTAEEKLVWARERFRAVTLARYEEAPPRRIGEGH